MKFVVLTCASANEKWAEVAEDLYVQKISPFIPFEMKELKIPKSGRDDKEFKIKNDSQAILKELKPEDYVILFDERGNSFSSREFSAKVQNILNTGKKRAVFIIGGAFGVDDSVKSRADLQVSFSKMVFNHLVAQTVCLEQIYRAFTILKNLPYHND